MSDEQATTEDAGGTQWDAPNQQVVRADGSAPWDEGSGGSASSGKKSRSKKSEKAAEEQAKDS